MHGAVSHSKLGTASWFPGANGSLVDIAYLNGKIRVTAFGRLYKGEEVDWSFRPYKRVEDGGQDLPSARLLPDVAHVRGTKELVAPSPVFGTDITTADKLRNRIAFEHGGKRVVLLRGKLADIVLLTSGQTYAVTVGGCPVGWMFDPARPEKLIVAHMGLSCLIDQLLVTKKEKSRRYKSVVERMWESLYLLSGDAKRVQAGVAFPIDPLVYCHEWNYPNTGDDNKLICEYLAANFGAHCIVEWGDPEMRKLGRIDLSNVIRSQYVQLGIPLHNIRRALAPNAVGVDGHPLWYVTRGPHDKDARNLVLITLYT